MAGCEAATEALKHQADLSVASLQELHAELHVELTRIVRISRFRTAAAQRLLHRCSRGGALLFSHRVQTMATIPLTDAAPKS